MAVSMETVLKLTAQVSGANNIQQVGNSLKNLSAASQMSERTIDKLYIATKQYGQAAGNSVNSINQQINALTNLRNAVDPTSNRYKVLTKDLQAYERQLQSLNATQQRQQAMHSAGGAAAGALMMGGGVQGALGAGAGALAMAGPGGMIAGAGLLAGGALIGTGVSNAMDVATQTRAISTLSDDAVGLTARIQGLVREQGYLTDRATAGAAAYEILSSGFSSTDDVLKILRASSEGAAGGFSDIKTVADAATSILNGYGMSAEQVTRVVDQMVVTQNDGKIKVNEYAQSIGRVIPTAAAAKISLEEINGAISALTAQGVPVESTFSGINQVIKSILKPTKEAADLSAALGLQFNGQALATKGLAGFLEDVSRKTGKSTDALSILFSDIDGYKAVVALLNDDLQRFNRFTDNQARSLNAAGIAAGKAIDPVKQFDNAWKDLSTTMGDVLLPTISEVLKGLTGLIKFLSSGPVQGVLSATSATLGGMATSIGGPIVAGARGANAVRERFPSVFGGGPAPSSESSTFSVPGVGTFDSKTQRLITPAAPPRLPTTATPPNVAAAIAKGRGTEPKAGSGGGGSGGGASFPDYIDKKVMQDWLKSKGFLRTDKSNAGHKTPNHLLNAMDMGYWAGPDYMQKTGEMERRLRATGAFPQQLFGPISDPSGHGNGTNTHLHIPTPGGRIKMNSALAQLMGLGGSSGDSSQQSKWAQDAVNEQIRAEEARKKAAKEAQRHAARVRDLRSEADLRAALWENEKQSMQAEKDKDFVKKARLDGERKMLELANKQAGIWAGDLPVQEKRLALAGGVVEMQRQSYRNVQDLASAQAKTDKKRTEELTNQVKLIYEQADAAGILADETRRYSELAFGGRLPDSTFTTGMDLMGKNQQDSRIGMGAMDGVNSWLDSVGTMRQSFQSLATDGIGGLTDALTELTTTGTTNFREFTAQILRDTTRIIIAQMVLRPLLGAIGGGGGGAFSPQITLPTAGPGWAPGFAEGGISTGPRSGYGAMLHGTEAIVPLSRGRAIPVQLSGGGGGGTAVTVNVDARGTQASGDNSRSEALGRDLSQVIDSRLAHHRRPGGLLA